MFSLFPLALREKIIKSTSIAMITLVRETCYLTHRISNIQRPERAIQSCRYSRPCTALLKKTPGLFSFASRGCAKIFRSRSLAALIFTIVHRTRAFGVAVTTHDWWCVRIWQTENVENVRGKIFVLRLRVRPWKRPSTFCRPISTIFIGFSVKLFRFVSEKKSTVGNQIAILQYLV